MYVCTLIDLKAHSLTIYSSIHSNISLVCFLLCNITFRYFLNSSFDDQGGRKSHWLELRIVMGHLAWLNRCFGFLAFVFVIQENDANRRIFFISFPPMFGCVSPAVDSGISGTVPTWSKKHQKDPHSQPCWQPSLVSRAVRVSPLRAAGGQTKKSFELVPASSTYLVSSQNAFMLKYMLQPYIWHFYPCS